MFSVFLQSFNTEVQFWFQAFSDQLDPKEGSEVNLGCGETSTSKRNRIVPVSRKARCHLERGLFFREKRHCPNKTPKHKQLSVLQSGSSSSGSTLGLWKARFRRFRFQLGPCPILLRPVENIRSMHKFADGHSMSTPLSEASFWVPSMAKTHAKQRET